MKVGILNERDDARVAVVPETLSKLKDLGLDILIERGAGESAMYSDETYAGQARIADRQAVLSEAGLLISINPPGDEELKGLSQDTVLISQFAPYFDAEVTEKLRRLKLRAFSMDMIPRTTLAQSMDVLSSMASIAGYRAVLEAAGRLPRYFPMMITAAGSIRPARVLVLGAGVAGLQAIATARRLGAMVEAFDTRQAAREEVLSLGAKFVEVEGAVEDTAAGGYAVEQTEEFIMRQRAEVQARAMKSDVIITTAQVRGRQAPLLVPKTTVDKMKPGSVIVDLAASTGGNCELTEDKKIVSYQGVTIIGNSQLAELMPQDASFLYSNNLYNFLKYVVKDGQLRFDLDDEIIRGALFTAEPTEASTQENKD